MEPKYYWIIAIFGLLVIGGFARQVPDTCEELANALDEATIDTERNGLFPITGEGLVGGTLIEIGEPAFDGSIALHTLSFKGINEVGHLHLMTSSDIPWSYTVGEFYKFNVTNILVSGSWSGYFIDINQVLLEHLQKCD